MISCGEFHKESTWYTPLNQTIHQMFHCLATTINHLAVALPCVCMNMYLTCRYSHT